MTVIHPRYCSIGRSLVTTIFVGAALLAPPMMGMAAAQPSAAAAAQRASVRQVLSAEVPDFKAAHTRLEEFARLADRLDKAPKISRAEFELLQREAVGLKATLPGFQRALSSSISKLRSSGNWNQTLDDAVAQALQRDGQTEALQEVRSAGGARALLQKGASDITRAPAEIDDLVRELQPKSAWHWLVDPLLGQPVHAGFGIGVLKVILAVGTAICKLVCD
jgi:hypothetical protein